MDQSHTLGIPVNASQDDRLAVSVAEACRLLCIGRTLFYELLDDGSLSSIKVRRRRLVPMHSIQRFVRGRLKNP